MKIPRILLERNFYIVLIFTIIIISFSHLFTVISFPNYDVGLTTADVNSTAIVGKMGFDGWTEVNYYTSTCLNYNDTGVACSNFFDSDINTYADSGWTSDSCVYWTAKRPFVSSELSNQYKVVAYVSGGSCGAGCSVNMALVGNNLNVPDVFSETSLIPIVTYFNYSQSAILDLTLDVFNGGGSCMVGSGVFTRLNDFKIYYKTPVELTSYYYSLNYSSSEFDSVLFEVNDDVPLGTDIVYQIYTGSQWQEIIPGIERTVTTDTNYQVRAIFTSNGLATPSITSWNVTTYLRHPGSNYASAGSSVTNLFSDVNSPYPYVKSKTSLALEKALDRPLIYQINYDNPISVMFGRIYNGGVVIVDRIFNYFRLMMAGGQYE